VAGTPADGNVSLYSAADPPACGLALHADRATSYDLHLTGADNAANSCIDSGDAAVVVATDIDGQARSDGLPDVGADEVP